MAYEPKNCIDGIRLLKIETRTVIVFSLFPIRRKIAWKLELSSFVSIFRQSVTVIVIQQTIDEHWMYFWIYLTAIILNWEQNCSIETHCARNILEHTSRMQTRYTIPYHTFYEPFYGDALKLCISRITFSIFSANGLRHN